MNRPTNFMPRLAARAQFVAAQYAAPKFSAATKDTTAELYLYDAIGPDMWGQGITSASVAEALAEMKGAKSLTVRINSPGGDVFDGVAIYNLIRAFKGTKTVCVDGLAASAASMIAMAGDEIVMAHNATMMIHEAWGGCIGNADAMRECADLLDKVTNDAVLGSYARTGQTPEQLRAWMKSDTWMSADEALARKFCDRVDSPPAAEAKPAKKAASEPFRPALHAAAVAAAIRGQYLATLRRACPAPAGVPASKQRQ